MNIYDLFGKNTNLQKNNATADTVSDNIEIVYETVNEAEPQFKAHRVPDINRSLPGIATAPQAFHQFANLKQNQPYIRKLTPSPIGHMQIGIENLKTIPKKNGNLVIKGNTVDTSRRRAYAKPWVIEVDSEGNIVAQNLNRLTDDELAVLEFNLVVRNRILKPNQIARKVAESRILGEKKHKVDKVNSVNDILHYTGKNPKVQKVVNRAYSEIPGARNDIEAIVGHIGNVDLTNQQQQEQIEALTRALIQAQQDYTKQEKRFQDLTAKIRSQGGRATPQQIQSAHAAQELEKSAPTGLAHESADAPFSMGGEGSTRSAATTAPENNISPIGSGAGDVVEDDEEHRPIPAKSIIQGYTVFWNPETRMAHITKGGHSAEASLADVRIDTPVYKNFINAVTRRIDRLDQELSGEIVESLRPGEYHVWTVHLDDGTQRRFRVPSDEYSDDRIKAYYARKGKQVVKIDYDWAVHSDLDEAGNPAQPADINDTWFKQGAFQTYKKAAPVKYTVPGQPGTVKTLEGPMKYSAQARIITGPKGEQYPVEPAKFAELYDDNGDGTATPKKIPKVAKLADHDGVLHTSWGDLQYTAGNDYIVRHGANDYGAVKKDIFAQTYALPQGVAEAKWDPWTGGDFSDEHDINHLSQNDAEETDRKRQAEKLKAMIQYHGNDALVSRALDDLYRVTLGGGYYDSIVLPNRVLATIVYQSLQPGKTEKRYFSNKQEAYSWAKGHNAIVTNLEKIDNQEDTSNLITLPVILGLGDHKKKWMLKFPSEDYAQKWEFKHKNVAKIQWPAGHGLAEEAGPVQARAVDAKGRTQQEWLALVKSKFPNAKILQAKMIDGPCVATLPNGKQLHWKKVEQGVAEAHSPEEFVQGLKKTAKKKHKFQVGDWVTIDPNETAGWATSGMIGKIVDLTGDGRATINVNPGGGATGVQRRLNNIDADFNIRSSGTHTVVPVRMLELLPVSLDEQGVAEGKDDNYYRVEQRDRNGKLQGVYHKSSINYPLQNIVSDCAYYQKQNPRSTFQLFVDGRPVDWKKLYQQFTQGVAEGKQTCPKPSGTYKKNEFDIAKPVTELSKHTLGNYVRANANDQVQHASSQSFKSGKNNDKYNTSDAWDARTTKREKGMDRALNKLTREDLDEAIESRLSAMKRAGYDIL